MIENLIMNNLKSEYTKEKHTLLGKRKLILANNHQLPTTKMSDISEKAQALIEEVSRAFEEELKAAIDRTLQSDIDEYMKESDKGRDAMIQESTNGTGHFVEGIFMDDGERTQDETNRLQVFKDITDPNPCRYLWEGPIFFY